MSRHSMPTESPLLALNRMAEFLGAHYDRTIAATTPYWWWKMEKAGKLPVNMPKPVQIHGQSPFFDPDAIVAWYAEYLDAIDEPYDVVKKKASTKSRRRRSQTTRQSTQ